MTKRRAQDDTQCLAGSKPDRYLPKRLKEPFASNERARAKRTRTIPGHLARAALRRAASGESAARATRLLLGVDEDRAGCRAGLPGRADLPYRGVQDPV